MILQLDPLHKLIYSKRSWRLEKFKISAEYTEEKFNELKAKNAHIVIVETSSGKKFIGSWTFVGDYHINNVGSAIEVWLDSAINSRFKVDEKVDINVLKKYFKSIEKTLYDIRVLSSMLRVHISMDMLPETTITKLNEERAKMAKSGEERKFGRKIFIGPDVVFTPIVSNSVELNDLVKIIKEDKKVDIKKESNIHTTNGKLEFIKVDHELQTSGKKLSKEHLEKLRAGRHKAKGEVVITTITPVKNKKHGKKQKH